MRADADRGQLGLPFGHADRRFTVVNAVLGIFIGGIYPGQAAQQAPPHDEHERAHGPRKLQELMRRVRHPVRGAQSDDDAEPKPLEE